MSLDQPDRVPLMCQFSWGFMNQNLTGQEISPMELWLDARKYAEALVFLRRQFNFDGILVSVHGHFEDWRSRVKEIRTENGIEVARFEDHIQTYVLDDLPAGQYFTPGEKDLESIDISSLPVQLDYIPASKNCHIYLDPEEPYRVFHLLEELTGGQYSIHAEVTSPLDYLLDLLGYEQALLAMITNPVKVKDLLQHFTRGVIKMANNLASLEIVDAIKISSPFAGMGFISTDFYQQFELPYIREIAEAINRKSKFSYLHTCGHINDRLELMASAGISGLECLDPPPIGNVELQDAFSRIGNRMFIKGNIDSVNILLKGSPDKIKEDVSGRILTGKENRGFILSTACSIAPNVPSEHITLLSEIVQEYGYY